MTDSKALIERLRVNVPYEAPRCLEAADHIEKLEADNARLREALTTIVEEYVTNVDCTRLGGFYLDPESEECVMEARAALQETSHDRD